MSAIELLDGPPVPESLEYLWNIFLRLDAMREYGDMGPRRFSMAHIKSGCDLFGWQLEPLEVEAIAVLDAVMLNPKAGGRS